MNSISYENESQYDNLDCTDDPIKRPKIITNDVSARIDSTGICEYEYEGRSGIELLSNFSSTQLLLSGKEYAHINELITGENCCNDCRTFSITSTIYIFR